jgi:antitoxin component of MazEF toxin-antitoxin module
MQIQRVFQAGNSHAVTIPKALVRDLGFHIGRKVIIEKAPDNTSILIKQSDDGNKKIKKSAADTEFRQWLNQFIEEDGEILDELANR